MANYLLVFSICLGSAAALSAQTPDQQILVSKDYRDLSFLEFTRQMESEQDVQFYFFPGWVADLVIKQPDRPTTLDDILSATLEGTDYHYFILPTG